MSYFLFTPLALLTSLPLSAFSEYILDFKPTNSAILTPFSPSFIFPSIFYLKYHNKQNLLGIH